MGEKFGGTLGDIYPKAGENGTDFEHGFGGGSQVLGVVGALEIAVNATKTFFPP